MEARDALETGKTRPMDAHLHAANGIARRHGGAQEVRMFLRGTWDAASDLALDAALAYLAEAPDDAEIYRDVVAHAESAGREGRRGFQLRALLGLLAVRGEWSAGLAPRLHDLLGAAVTELQSRGGCDESPLLSGVGAQQALQDPTPALKSAARRLEPTQLSASTLAALVRAFPRGSPLAEDVDALLNALEPRAPVLVTSARHLAKHGQQNALRPADAADAGRAAASPPSEGRP
jgi:hypothetical protein